MSGIDAVGSKTWWFKHVLHPRIVRYFIGNTEPSINMINRKWRPDNGRLLSEPDPKLKTEHPNFHPTHPPPAEHDSWSYGGPRG